MATVNCPSCSRALEVDDSYRDWTVRCPHCATEFVPSEATPELAEPAPPARDDRSEDEYDRPRRRRRRPDPERDEWERQEAVSIVHGPGTWLEISGWLGGLLLVGGGILRFVVAAAEANNPNLPPEELAGLIFGGVVSVALALPYTIVLVVGARKMRALSSYNWAMTASVVGISSFMLLCCICVCSFFPVGFGIWGVVTLNNPIVRRAFEFNARAASWDD